jgi:transcriptional regulator with XRE-family HTH domain
MENLKNSKNMGNEEFLVALGSRIKAIRAEKKMSQINLAAKCDFEKASMSRIESGKTNSTILTLRKISNALDVDVSDLFRQGQEN